ncbi:DUF3072 domain-containing protein [Gemmata sp. JC673]|uniref:DUF3072 domain-containing protein n=1 Tax=Gemmata algarum TaxID=2975278 RepID=A0ABU5F8F1_9BACT|nr:DUF3072 domain-containing protein [Gemmata algarum]MDY3563611.1 DUF3072 domain-containing protein [Gemmata algarum]
MSANNSQPQQPADAIKDPKDWVTGDEPMTGAQESYVNTLARQAGQDVPEDMTKAEASEKIEELREQTGKTKRAAKPKSARASRKKSA